MYKITICDDNPADIRLLCSYLESSTTAHDISISTFQDGTELVQSYKEKGCFDLIILDMMMDHMNGIEAAEAIRNIDESVTILIVTATVEYAIDGYKVNAVRYIVKPVEKNSFLKLIESLYTDHSKKHGLFYTFPSKNGTTAIPMEDIYYFESELRSIHVVSKQGRHTFTGRISSVEEETTGQDFVRVHKSFIVNMKHIHNIFKDSITLDTGDTIPLSHHKHKEINQKFLEYMEAQLL